MMPERWVRATRAAGEMMTGKVIPANSSGAGVGIDLGENSSAFLNFREWDVVDILGPVDPDSPLGVAIAAFWHDWSTTDNVLDLIGESEYAKGYVDMVMAVAQRVDALKTSSVYEQRAETIQILNDNRPNPAE